MIFSYFACFTLVLSDRNRQKHGVSVQNGEAIETHDGEMASSVVIESIWLNIEDTNGLPIWNSHSKMDENEAIQIFVSNA